LEQNKLEKKMAKKKCPENKVLKDAQKRTPTVKSREEIEKAIEKDGWEAKRKNINKKIEATDKYIDTVNTAGSYAAVAFGVGNQALGIYNNMIDNLNAAGEELGCKTTIGEEKDEVFGKDFFEDEHFSKKEFYKFLKEVGVCSINPFGCNGWNPVDAIHGDGRCRAIQRSNHQCKMDLAEAMKEATEGNIFALLDAVSTEKNIFACTTPYFENFFNSVPWLFYISKIIASTAGNLLEDMAEGQDPMTSADWEEVPCGRELITKSLRQGTDFEFPPIPEIPRIPRIPNIKVPGWLQILKNILYDAICWEICCLLTPLLKWCTVAIIKFANEAVEGVEQWDGLVDPTKQNPKNLMPELKKTDINSFISDEALHATQVIENFDSQIPLILANAEVQNIRNFLTAVYDEDSIKQRHIVYLLMGEADCYTLATLVEIASRKEFESLWAEPINDKACEEGNCESIILRFFTFIGKYTDVIEMIAESKEDVCFPDACTTVDEITKDTFIEISKALCDLLNPDIGMPKVPVGTILSASGADEQIIKGIKTQTDVLFEKAKLNFFRELGAENKVFSVNYAEKMKEFDTFSKFGMPAADKITGLQAVDDFVESCVPMILDDGSFESAEGTSATAKGATIYRGIMPGVPQFSTILMKGDKLWSLSDYGYGGGGTMTSAASGGSEKAFRNFAYLPANKEWLGDHEEKNRFKNIQANGPLIANNESKPQYNTADLARIGLVEKEKTIGKIYPGLAGYFDSAGTRWESTKELWRTYFFKGDKYWATDGGNSKLAVVTQGGAIKSWYEGMDEFLKENGGKFTSVFSTYADGVSAGPGEIIRSNDGKNTEKKLPAHRYMMHFIAGNKIARFSTRCNSDASPANPKCSQLTWRQHEGFESYGSKPMTLAEFPLFLGVPDSPTGDWKADGFDEVYTWADGLTYLFKGAYYFVVDSYMHYDVQSITGLSPTGAQGLKGPWNIDDGPSAVYPLPSWQPIEDWGAIFATAEQTRRPVKRYEEKECWLPFSKDESGKKICKRDFDQEQIKQYGIKNMFEANLKGPDGADKTIADKGMNVEVFIETKKDMKIDSEYMYGIYNKESGILETGYKNGRFNGLKIMFDEYRKEEIEEQKIAAEEKAELRLDKMMESF
jgi:hypothetical protein